MFEVLSLFWKSEIHFQRMLGMIFGRPKEVGVCSYILSRRKFGTLGMFVSFVCLTLMGLCLSVHGLDLFVHQEIVSKIPPPYLNQ